MPRVPNASWVVLLLAINTFLQSIDWSGSPWWITTAVAVIAIFAKGLEAEYKRTKMVSAFSGKWSVVKYILFK